MKMVAIIQARMGSTRLHGKVLLDLGGEPVLARVVRRVARAKRVDSVVVATTIQSEDNAIEGLCHERGWACYRGSAMDVLDRYYQAARHFDADVVVRITSDCPLIEPTLIDEIVETLVSERKDYVTNTIAPRTFPRGLDVEAMTFAALHQAWTEDQDPAWREHVTPYLYRSGKFDLKVVKAEHDHSVLRWTLDVPEDLALLRKIYDHFKNDHMSWTDVLEAVKRHPSWNQLNSHVEQKVVA